MFSYLYAILSARAINQKLIIDVDCNMMDLIPAFTLAGAAAVSVCTVSFASRSVLPRKEDEITCLQLRWICKKHSHFITLLRHSVGIKPIHGCESDVIVCRPCQLGAVHAGITAPDIFFCSFYNLCTYRIRR